MLFSGLCVLTLSMYLLRNTACAFTLSDSDLNERSDLFPVSAPSLTGYHYILTAASLCLDGVGLLRGAAHTH